MESHDFMWTYWKLLKQANETKSIVHECLGKQFNLTQLQFNVLIKIDTLEDKSISSLARIFQKDHGNISKICTVLEEKGYIYREKSPEDNRVVFLYLTKKGRTYMSEFERCIKKPYEELTKEMSRRDLEKFLDSMVLINKYFTDSEAVKENKEQKREIRRAKRQERSE